MTKASISWSAKQIAKAVELGSMNFDNAIQRGKVWDVKRQILLIDSILRNYPIPPMYTIKTDEDAPEGCKKGSKVFDCIDGKQRCEAVRAFRNDEFYLDGCEPINGEEVNGKTYSELSEDLRDAFDTYIFNVYYLTDISDDEIADMMSRLNNGKPLTGVENARIKAKSLPAIIKLASHPLFTENMTEAAIKAYSNEDAVIKTVLQCSKNEFELSTKNVKDVYETFEFGDVLCKLYEGYFDKTKEVLDIFKEKARKGLVKNALKKTNLVNIIYLCCGHSDYESEGLAEFLEWFFDGNMGEEYITASINGTNHAPNVMARNEAMESAFAKGAGE